MKMSTKKSLVQNSRANSLKVLFVSYEASPFYKRGGLGDVIGSLPNALQLVGVDARVVMPYYQSVRHVFPQKRLGNFSVSYDNQAEEVGVYEGVFPGTKTPIYFLSHHNFISVINLRQKRIEEFAFFDLAVVGFVNWLENQALFVPSVIHCNDWHTALIPLLLQTRMHSNIRSVLTIHNLGYQGKGSLAVLDKLGVIDDDIKVLKRQEEVGELNALGEGIVHADIVSTVSHQYAKDIAQTRKKRKSIAPYLRIRESVKGGRGEIVGILNGIDQEIWNPSRDVLLPHRYSQATVGQIKQKNKTEVLKRLRLPEDRVLISFIGRFAEQKGLDVIKGVAEELASFPLALVLLGSGANKKVEDGVKRLENRFPLSFRVHVGYNEETAHLLFGSSDFLLIPSHYEPCGLIQMIGMAYGSVPIASDTGGLHDTIEQGKTGLLFKTGSAKDLVQTVKHALDVYRDKERYARMREVGMEQDFSWDKSAKEYVKLYESILTSSS